ncbi:hypothetical protein BBOV_III008010 [Babesia bovis T2Bo]|uniref:DnaJ domain containing protein n=1 Tax=Babesia bovis TaxID=5865 RepID=A7AP77_BABBO|nr:hypothetical protein BBOV_III008010 [Babesia bovis T2Bo]EDO08361.1 hypothetical protein BBOV_III008010 [Babesia bovis T2Bo]|eukprot:XP_001611929.1 hypothetical protein [Babesia bovis T2Bo]
MPWPIVALACGTGVLLGRYMYRAVSKSKVLYGFEHKMSLSEACAILNVSATAPKDRIREHYKQLMMRNHPDNGGSTYLASKVNEAKDYLLK